MKIGIGVPCHVDDVSIAEKYVLPSISRLDPAPDQVFIYVNDCGLKAARTRIFDKLLLEDDCDVVLQACTDYYFFENILSFVKSDKVVTFAPMSMTPLVSLSMILGRNLAKSPWAGCYSLPKHIWKEVRESGTFNGHDYTIQKHVKNNYHFTRAPNYMLRRIEGNHVKKLVLGPLWESQGIHQKALKLIQALKI